MVALDFPNRKLAVKSRKNAENNFYCKKFKLTKMIYFLTLVKQVGCYVGWAMNL